MNEQTLKISIASETEAEKPKYDEWEIKNAVDTLMRAEEIKQDAELMALVAPELEKRTKAVKGLADVLYGNEEVKKEEK